MTRLLPACIAALALAGCASPGTVPMERVGSGPYTRDAALIESKLEGENKNPYECIVRDDTLIVCDSVRHTLR